MTNDLVALAAHRRALLDGIFIETPRTIKAHEAFRSLMEHGKHTPKNKLCVLLVAPSHSGKSVVISTFVEKHNTPERRAARETPVLHVTLHAEVTRKGLAQDILLGLQKALDIEAGIMKGTEQELWERVYSYLRTAKVQLLVLDEIHHVKYANSDRMARSVGECIKHALIEGPCPIVLSGIESAELPFDANEQLRARSRPAIQLTPFSGLIDSDMELFTDFLARYVVRMEALGIARNAEALIEGDIPACILKVSNGVLGTACRLIKEAVELMTLAGRDYLIRSDLSDATDLAFLALDREKTAEMNRLERSKRLNKINPFIAGCAKAA